MLYNKLVGPLSQTGVQEYFFTLIRILKHHNVSQGNIHLKVNDVIHVSQPANYPDSSMCEVVIRPVGLNSGEQSLNQHRGYFGAIQEVRGQ